MTAASIAVLPEGTRLISAAALALMTGGILLIAGIVKAGFIMNFVSRPVVSAYITGAALLIIISQPKTYFRHLGRRQYGLCPVTGLIP